MKNHSGESGYKKLLRDPRWQKRRLEVLNAANWKCEDAGCQRNDSLLEVHHCYYIWGRDPWDYPRDCFIALCGGCHEKRQAIERTIKVSVLQCLRDIPIKRLELIAWRLIQSAIAGQEDGR